MAAISVSHGVCGIPARFPLPYPPPLIYAGAIGDRVEGVVPSTFVGV
jgi:hypothetical protein